MSPPALLAAGAHPPKTTALRSIALLLPWILLAFVIFLVWIDNIKTGTTLTLDSTSSAAAAENPTAIDPFCNMEVKTSNAHRAVHGGKTFYFCSTFCRDHFAEDPQSHDARTQAPDSHTMRGIPTWMYQATVAIVIFLSFGLFELLAWMGGKSSHERAPPRFDLTALPGVRSILKWPPLTFVLRAITAASFLLVIAAGLFGDQNPAMNIAPLLTWTVWWAGLIFIILFLGKAWCTVCPWDALATWLERLKCWGPRTEGAGLELRWPSAMRNIWPAVTLFLLLTWVELGMGVTLVPRATAWIALGMLALAIGSVFIFDRKAFCRYGCLVGRVSGLYALFSPIEVRSSDPTVCASCRTMDCYRGNDKGDGCPTFEFPRSMDTNTYCILCTECFKTCPHDNMSMRLRPWGADLIQKGKPRSDEAFLALILLSMTGFHGLTMTPSWAQANTALQSAWNISYWSSFSLLMTAMLVLPIALYASLIWASTVWSGPTGFKTLFIHYAYAMLPIALFYHLAHNAEHFLMEGPKLIALISDPFGWGWNIFGTASWKAVPAITLEGLWWIQILFILIGHVYGLWISEKTTRRLIPNRRAAFFGQLPMLTAMVAFSVFSLWLLKQPMEMRLSGM